MERRVVPPEKLPDPVRAYVEALHVNVVEPGPREEKPPGFKYPVYIIPVIDEGTEETIEIIQGYPVAELPRYKLVRITNKLGYAVTVLTFKEEVPKIEVKVAPTKVAEKVSKEAEKAMPIPKPYRIIVDWRWLSDIGKRGKDWLKACERHAEARNAPGLYMYMRSFEDFFDKAKKRLLGASPEAIGTYEKRKEPPIIILKPEEKAMLWEWFSSELKKEKIDPERYRKVFEESVAPNETFELNKLFLRYVIRDIIAEEGIRRAKFKIKVPKPPIRFRWKMAGWALSAIKLELERYQRAVKEKDGVEAYMAAKEISESARRLRTLLEQLRSISFFEGKERFP